MSAATLPSLRPWTHRLLRIGEDIEHRCIDDLPELLEPGDLLVVNDAATLPASLMGEGCELRLAGPLDEGWVVSFGTGDWRTDTDRRPERTFEVGEPVTVGGMAGIVVEVSPLSPRLVRVEWELSGPALWTALYRQGRPVQYSYLDRALALDEVQTPYAARPWAVEMPSAGRPLGEALRKRLAERGVAIASLTHAAGLSATGDPALDAALPLPERSDIPAETLAAVESARRVIAVGTSVVRALEDRARTGWRPGVTTSTLRLGPGSELLVVDGLLSGMHEPGESHFELMAAFEDLDRLRAADRHARARGYRGHEFGDFTLLFRRQARGERYRGPAGAYARRPRSAPLSPVSLSPVGLVQASARRVLAHPPRALAHAPAAEVVVDGGRLAGPGEEDGLDELAVVDAGLSRGRVERGLEGRVEGHAPGREDRLGVPWGTGLAVGFQVAL